MSDFTPWEDLSDREQLIQFIWDAWKDAYGFRPRHIDFASMSDLELEDLYSKICDDIC